MQLMSITFRTALVASAVLLSACAGLRKSDTPAYDPSFEFQPKPDPAGPTTDAAPVATAIIQPSWSAGGPNGDAAMKKFRTAVASGLASSLKSKRLAFTGTFPDVNEMTYADKKAAHLAVVTDLQIDFVCDAEAVGIPVTINDVTWNTYEVEAGTEGAVIFKVIEPQSRELLWQTRVELDRHVSTIQDRAKEDVCDDGPSGAPRRVRNVMLKSLEQQYGTLMQKIDRQLSRSELAALGLQANELKSKKVY